MTALERDSFHADMIRVAKAVKKVFKPDAIDYMYFEDVDENLLFHIIPKYQGAEDFGKSPVYDAGKELTEDEYKDLVAKIGSEIK